jgi:hypothetical protein
MSSKILKNPAMINIRKRNRTFFIVSSLLIFIFGWNQALFSMGANKNEPPVKPQPLKASPQPAEPVKIVIPVGTDLKVQLNQFIRTSTHRSGQTFFATLKDPVSAGNQVLLQSGSPLIGAIVQSQESGHFSGSALIELQLTRMIMPDGATMPLSTESFKKLGRAHFMRNVGLIGLGVILGAGLGNVFGELSGALIGSGLGGGTGAVLAYVTGKEDLFIKAGTEVVFKLSRPLNMVVPQAAAPAK